MHLFSAAADWADAGIRLVAASMADTKDDYDYNGELANSLRRIGTTFGIENYGALVDRARR